ncbi:RecT-like ssDNA binding protein [Corynebacterium phage CL31]|nr:RecT-like ssDNA binding protein [Corynebacterium phage CL31]
MSWISKSLTLDLLAITIDGLNKVFDRISAEPDAAPGVSPWPTDAPAAPAPVEAPPAAAPQPTPAPSTPAAPQPEPDLDPAPEPAPDLLPEAQTALRTIAQTQGTDWIRETLFPHFGTTTLNDIPAEKLPELIAMAKAQAGAAA